MPKIKITSADLVYSGWAKLTRYKLDIEKRGGGTLSVVREVHDHGHGAAVLPYDATRGTVLLARQFRLPVYLGGFDGMLIEACAGLLDGDAPEACAIREAEEELGYRIRNLKAHGRMWGSPGAIAESNWLFTADYSAADRISKGGGKIGEDEDVEVLEISLAEAMRLVSTNEISDAKSVILLQYLWMAMQGSTR
jgi:nudix-type nucleoside diphosphatase (YffH/AdpP family)